MTTLLPEPRQVIDEAVASFTTRSGSDAASLLKTTALDDVKRILVNIQRDQAARQSLRNMRRLAPLLEGLSSLAGVLDLLYPGEPCVNFIWVCTDFLRGMCGSF